MKLADSIRGSWRMVRFGCSLIYQSAKLDVLARRQATGVRDRFRAEQQRRACGRFCEILGIQVTVRGERPTEGRLLAVSNHLGIIDPYILASTLPIAFAAKAEMASWPIMGWVCRVIGVIFVERDRRMAAGRFVEQVQHAMDSGVRVLVFPEGTTSDGHTLLPFKTSAFEAVAGMSDTAVLPICMVATSVNGRDARRDPIGPISWVAPTTMIAHARRLLAMRSIHVTVHIGRPLETVDRNRKQLAKAARDAVRELSAVAEPVDDAGSGN